jgi:acyl-CoA reductase-like NAD-dependent aldehyde dehydrogenase
MKPSLLLIDLQRDFLATADLQPVAPALISRAAELLQACRERGLPIIHVWTTVERGNDRRLPHWRKLDRWMCVAGTPGHETPPALRPLPGETIVHKAGFNPFASGELEKVLRAHGCDSVVLAGLHLHACVRTAAVESLERDFQVFIAEDATASNDPIHAAATRRWLAERCVTFQSSSALLRFLQGDPPAKWIHRSPRCTGEILFEIANTGTEDINSAATAAKIAWARWRRTPLSARQQILEAMARRLEAAADELARQMAIEIGKPIRHGREEIHRAAANVRDVIRRAAVLSAPKREAAGLVRHEPLGVVGIISAWNNPVAIPLGKIAPALIYGNAVLWKPAPATTRIAESLLRLFHESNLPADVLRMAVGDHTTAQNIAANENVDAVTLTGSLAAGHAIQEICARRIIPLQAELSGNNAAIIWDDADLAAAAAQVAWGAFAFAGQRCTANRRVIIHAARFEPFLHELELATARLPWGDPLAAETEIGPVIHVGKRDELEVLVADAENSGAARWVRRPCSSRAGESWVKTGAYAQPVIACCDHPEHALVQEETMSPMLVVQRAEDFEHALALCNGVRHGLIASLFSHAAELGKIFIEEARAGILKLNSSTAGVDVTLPFGGWKASGLGPPEHGDGDFQFYTRMQAVYGAGE